MPTLDWIGKKAVVNHHRQVPYHLLRCDNKLSYGDPESGNLVIEGDNLLALNALLPYYAGQVKCIYIDPPYNTGNENWVYNDNVNSPEMRKWLGKVVGGEAEDLSRHDKWLCMMYPRLTLLKDFLRKDGVIFISIDDYEVHSLRAILQEVDGLSFVGTIVWERKRKGSHLSRKLTKKTEYIIICSKESGEVELVGEPVGPEEDFPLIKRTNSVKTLRIPENKLGITKLKDGTYAAGHYGRGNTGVELVEPVQVKDGKFLTSVLLHGRFIWTQENLDAELGAGGMCFLRTKNFSLRAIKAEENQGYKGLSSLLTKEYGTNEDASTELAAIFQTEVNAVFQYSKPTKLVQTLIRSATFDMKDAVVLDSFAGSGTTGEAVLNLNKTDGGNRRFILVEMEQEVCRDITSKRLGRVIEGYEKSNGESAEKVEGLGGGFRYCRLDKPLFDDGGNIGSEVSFGDLAAHIFFTETGRPIAKRASGKSPFLGAADGVGYYLLFNGVLGDKSVNGGNVLTSKVLGGLAGHDGPKVIFGEGCRLGRARLKRERITFRQIPYEIKVS